MKLTSDLDFGKLAQAKGLILEQTTNPTTAVALLTEIGQIAYIQSTGRPIVRTSSGFSPLAFLADITASRLQRWHIYEATTKTSYAATAAQGILPSQSAWKITRITVLDTGATTKAVATNAIRDNYLSLTYL